jgi:hypothetical protein
MSLKFTPKFIEWSALELGITIRFEGEGLDENVYILSM